MIQCIQPAKPAGFDEAVQEAKENLLTTLAHNGGSLPAKYKWSSKWTDYHDLMAEKAHFYCTYTGTQRKTLDLNIDHYLPKANYPEKAYEWDNYRIAWHWINNHKRNRIVLDPYLVQQGWFKITIPGFQLVIANITDPEIHRKAQQTLGKELGLDLNNQHLVNERGTLYQKFVLGRSLEDVSEEMPLLGEAIRQFAIRFIRKSVHENRAVTSQKIANYIATPVGSIRRSMKIADAQRLVATLCVEGIVTEQSGNLSTI